MSIPYNFGIPNPPNNPSADVPLMQQNANSIFNFVKVDHIGFDTTFSSSGYHNVIHFANQAADPATVAGVGQLYTKTVTGDQVLFYESGLGKVSQLTASVTPSPIANGYTFLPGGLILQYGSVAPTNTVMNNITFPLPFPSGNPPFSITFSTTSPSGTVPGTTWAFWVSTGATTTATQFQIYNNSTHTFGYFWMAIGI